MSSAVAKPPRTKLITADEFLAWCSRPENDDGHFELVRGEVIQTSAPTRIHGVVSANIACHLSSYCRMHGGYITINDAGTLLERDPDTVRGPDVAYFTDAETFEDLHPKYGEHPPLLAVEVLSPNDRASKVLRKIDDYVNNGVLLVWLIDPEEKTVRISKAGELSKTLTADQEIDGSGVLPDFRCALSEFFKIPKHLSNEAATPNAPPAN